MRASAYRKSRTVYGCGADYGRGKEAEEEKMDTAIPCPYVGKYRTSCGADFVGESQGWRVRP